MLKCPNVPTTFRGMASLFFRYILMKARSIPDVKNTHIVFDKYNKNSIKCFTRQNRGESMVVKNATVKPSIQIPQDWKTFLQYGDLKNNLCDYYKNYFASEGPNLLRLHENLFSSGGITDEVIKFSFDSISNIPTLQSNQEEADTRIMLHARYEVGNGAQNIVVDSPDTDVCTSCSPLQCDRLCEHILSHRLYRCSQ